MACNGIRDRVAIVGMGCTPFGEHWDKSADDLLVDAVARTRSTRPACTIDDDRRLLARHARLGQSRAHALAARSS